MKKFQPTTTMLKIEGYAKRGLADEQIARFLGLTEMQVAETREKFREGVERKAGVS